jgi:hypothetical protein
MDNELLVQNYIYEHGWLLFSMLALSMGSIVYSPTPIDPDYVKLAAQIQTQCIGAIMGCLEDVPTDAEGEGGGHARTHVHARARTYTHAYTHTHRYRLSASGPSWAVWRMCPQMRRVRGEHAHTHTRTYRYRG